MGRLTFRLTDEAYEVLMRVPKRIRASALSEVIVRADREGWWREIKKKRIREIVKELGLDVSEIMESLADLSPSKPDGPEPNDDETDDLQDRLDGMVGW